MRLFEIARTGTLYHGTSVLNLVCILLEDRIRPSEGVDDGPVGVCLTRSRKIAWSCANDRQETEVNDSIPQDYDAVPPGMPRGAVLELNGPAVRQAFRTVDYQWEGDTFEEEERVIGSLRPMSSFLVGFEIRTADLQWHLDLLGPTGNRHVLAMLHNLLQDPRRREP